MKKHLWLIVLLAFCGFNVNGQTQLITNGNFSSSTGWSISGNWYISSAFSCYNLSSGYAFAGNSSGQAVINETGDLKQTVTIPSTATSATLSFYASKSTDETSTTTVYDYVNVFLLDASGTQLMQFTPTNINNLYSGYPVTACDGYSLKTFSIPSTYFGQPVQVVFRVHSDGGPKNTMFRIDDVSLTYTASATCTYSISTPSITLGYSSGNGLVSVTATSGCSWTAVSNNTSWLTVTSGSSGTGNGTIGYSYTTNNSASLRTGTITIAGHLFTVVQSGTTSGLLHGVDISSQNGTGVTWSSVYLTNHFFAYVRATKGIGSSGGGNCWTDPRFPVPNMTSSNPNGVVLGAYHVALPEDNPGPSGAVAEANYFYSVASSYMGAGFLPPALDLEDPGTECNVNTAKLDVYYNTDALKLQLAQWVNIWCNRIYTLTGKWPVLYVTRCHANLLVSYYTDGTINSNIKLWIATNNTATSPAGSPASYAGCGPNWNTWPWVFHQYLAPGEAGINPTEGAEPGMDQDVFNGDLTAFNNLIGSISTCTDQHESNNSAASASLVFALPVASSSNLQWQGNIGYIGDDDWYKINIGACGTITVNLSNLPNDYDLELWDKYSSNVGYGTVLSGSYNTGNSNETVSFSYQGSNTAYIKVYAKNHQSYTTNSCYNIQFIFTPCTGGPPSNDICSNATLLDVHNTCIPLTNQFLTNANSENNGTVCDDAYPGVGYDVWYKFVANNSAQNIIIDNGGKFYIHTAIYPDCSSARIACDEGERIISYSLNNLTAGKTYYIQIHDDQGYAQNMPFSICVYGASCTPPLIISQPVNQNLVAPGNANFTISANGSANSYLWQYNTGSGWINVPNSSPYSGVTSSSLTISTTSTSMNGYQYRCYVTSTCSTSTSISNAATLTVTATCVAPNITVQPANQIVTAPGGSSFNISANGSANLYQWQYNTGSGWLNVPNSSPYSGANNNILSISTSSTSMNSYQYRCYITSTCTTSTSISNAATLTVTTTCIAPNITVQPINQIITVPGACSFNILANGSANSYQWQYNTGSGWINVPNSSPYSGATTNILNISTTSLSMNSYQYRCYVTSSCTTSTSSSNSATLTVTAVAILPTLTTTVSIASSVSTASSGGYITSDGGAPITARGVCWSLSINPTIQNSISVDGTGSGSFTSSITGLTSNTTYHVRAYATNSVGTGYGSDMQFTTLPTAPAIGTVNQPTCIQSFGSIVLNGLPSSGTWTLIRTPGGTTTTSSGSSTTVSGLDQGTYTFQVTNAEGGTSGSSASVMIAAQIMIPTVFTSSVFDATQSTASSGGNVTLDGGATVTIRGVCWSTTSNPTILNSKTSDGLSIGTFTSIITGLTNGITYHIRAYATNCKGTAYGSDIQYIHNSTGIEDIQGDAVSVFPNPVSGVLNIVYKDDNYETIMILNSQGRLLSKEKVIKPNQQLDFSLYDSGLYILEFIKKTNEIRRIKVIKQ